MNSNLKAADSPLYEFHHSPQFKTDNIQTVWKMSLVLALVYLEWWPIGNQIAEMLAPSSCRYLVARRNTCMTKCVLSITVRISAKRRLVPSLILSNLKVESFGLWQKPDARSGWLMTVISRSRSRGHQLTSPMGLSKVRLGLLESWHQVGI